MIVLDLFFNSILGHKPIFAFFLEFAKCWNVGLHYRDAITLLRSPCTVHFCWIFSLMAHNTCFHARYVLLGVRLNFLIISVFIAKIPKVPYSRNVKLVANLRIDIPLLVWQLLTTFLVLWYGFRGRPNQRRYFWLQGLRNVAMATTFWPK